MNTSQKTEKEIRDLSREYIEEVEETLEDEAENNIKNKI